MSGRAPASPGRRRGHLVVAALLTVAPWGCKRDADAPLPADQLFPKKPRSPASPLPPFGGLQRLTEVAETEPNDDRAHAQPLAVGTVIHGQLSPGRLAPGADDWYAIDPSVSPGAAMRLELRDAPGCAVLTLTDRDGQLRQRATMAGGAAVLNHLAPRVSGVFAHVRCDPERPRGKRGHGAYRLLLSSRPRMPTEEVEPNDRVGQEVLSVDRATPVQGTIGRAGDVDLWRATMAEREVVTLSLTGLPGLLAVLQVRDERGEVVLQRRGLKGQPIVIPNLSPPQTTVLAAVLARGDATSEHSYALAIQPASDAIRRLDEREPNDTRATAGLLAMDRPATGVIDSPNDVDWWEVITVPGTALGVTLRCPEGVKARLVVHPGDGKPVWATAASGGATLRLERVPALAEKVGVRVHGIGRDHDVLLPYQLEVANLSAVDAALDLGDGATPASPGAAATATHGGHLP